MFADFSWYHLIPLAKGALITVVLCLIWPLTPPMPSATMKTAYSYGTAAGRVLPCSGSP